MDWCSEFLKAYCRAQCPISHSSPSADPVEWSPSATGFVKVNIDVAFPVNADYFRVSGVARDDRGLCLWGFRHEIVGRPQPSDGAAIAMLHGVRAALVLSV